MGEVTLLAHYREQLRLQAEAVRREKDATAVDPRHRIDSRLRASAPLTTQITELMSSLPPSQRYRSWSIVDLRGRLHGRYQDRPSLGDIGVALRALGWVRVRDWTNDGEGRRLWSPSAELRTRPNNVGCSRA